MGVLLPLETAEWVLLLENSFPAGLQQSLMSIKNNCFIKLGKYMHLKQSQKYWYCRTLPFKLNQTAFMHWHLLSLFQNLMKEACTSHLAYVGNYDTIVNNRCVFDMQSSLIVLRRVLHITVAVKSLNKRSSTLSHTTLNIILNDPIYSSAIFK